MAAAGGHHGRATELAIEAARTAAASGAAAMAMNFLTDAARYGDARRAAAALPEPGRAAGHATAAASGRPTSRPGRIASPERLLDAAEAQLLAGFHRHCVELAELARRPTSRGARRGGRPRCSGRPGSGWASTESSAAALSASPLTQRETEVTRLASRGLSDREIADELVLSIRTVQSHLASAYRKLGHRLPHRTGPALRQLSLSGASRPAVLRRARRLRHPSYGGWSCSRRAGYCVRHPSDDEWRFRPG